MSKKLLWQTFELNRRNLMQPRWLDFSLRYIGKFVLSPMPADNSEIQQLTWALLLLYPFCYKNKTWDMQNELSSCFVSKHFLRAKTRIISVQRVWGNRKTSIPMGKSIYRVHMKLTDAYGLFLHLYVVKTTNPDIISL